MATPSQIKDRIVLVAGQVPGIATSLDDYPDKEPFEDHELPAMVTRLVSTQLAQVRVTRQHMYTGLWIERWEIPLVLHVTHCDNDDVLAPNTAEMEACEPFLRSVPAYFAGTDRLSCSECTPPLSALVYDIEPMQSTGIIRIARNSASYWGIAFTLPVLEEVNY